MWVRQPDGTTVESEVDRQRSRMYLFTPFRKSADDLLAQWRGLGIRDDVSQLVQRRGTRTSNLKLDIVVPDSARVGELNRALPLAFQTLNVGRVMVAAQSLGLALAAYREAARRAVERRAFGQPIIENQGIGFNLADMARQSAAAR